MTKIENGPQRLAPSGRPMGPRTGVYNGHEFELDSTADLFKCDYCQTYEVVVQKDADPETGLYPACPGLPGWDGDTTRAYVLITFNPAADGARTWNGTVSETVWASGVGRPARYGNAPRHPGGQLVETVASKVDELVAKLHPLTERATFPGRNGGKVPPVVSLDVVPGDEGDETIADNYAAYVAEYGDPAVRA